VAQARALRAALRRGGQRRYEISNYARPGRASAHNRLYWDGESYLGLGAGAYGCRRSPAGLAGTVRYGNLRDAAGWLAAVEAGRLPGAELDEIDVRADRNERLMLALRTTSGAPLSGLSAAQAVEVEGLVRRRLAVRRAGSLVLTSRGMELHSAIAERLFE
jgi:oxygen-independent coproporphyrinogen-3 oxidase